MCTFNKRNCIVDKSLKIVKLIKNAVRLILDNFGIVGFLVFGRMPVDSSHFSPHFDSILSPKYFISKALKRSFDPIVRTNWRPTGKCSVLNITLVFTCACRRNAESFICRRAPHFSTGSPVGRWSVLGSKLRFKAFEIKYFGLKILSK
jgi:hypothetical protein